MIGRKYLAALATQLMEWKNIHHVPVEDKDGNICGLLTWTHMKRWMESEKIPEIETVRDIMTTDIITADSEMRIDEAIPLMKQHEIGCLPVLHDQHLIGIVTIKDIQQYDQD